MTYYMYIYAYLRLLNVEKPFSEAIMYLREYHVLLCAENEIREYRHALQPERILHLESIIKLGNSVTVDFTAVASEKIMSFVNKIRFEIISLATLLIGFAAPGITVKFL